MFSGPNGPVLGLPTGSTTTTAVFRRGLCGLAADPDHGRIGGLFGRCFDPTVHPTSGRHDL